MIDHKHLSTFDDSLFELGLRYISVSSTVILFYDTILTLDLEIAYVWRSHVPFLLTFYLSPNISVEQCSRLHMGQQWLFGLGVGSAQGVLVLRTISLYDHDKNMRSYICLFLFLVYTPVTLILVLWANAAKFGPPPPGVQGCHISEKNYMLFTAYVALALTETVLVILTVRQVIKKFGNLINNEDRSSYSLIQTLNRDGILFFICLFLLSIANMMVSFHGPYMELLSPLQRILHGTLTSRMVLHLREAAALAPTARGSEASSEGRTSVHPTNRQLTSRVSSIRFERFASPTYGDASDGLQDMKLRPHGHSDQGSAARPLVDECKSTDSD